MQRLGYTDSDFYRLYYRNRLNSTIQEACDRIRKDPQFTNKIAAAEDRPLNNLEYLYAMFAIDGNDASACAKISPNARKPWFHQQTISLQIECYHDLARNNRDAKFCQKVPTSSHAAPRDADNESRETCLRDVAIEQASPPSKAYWGPGLPPTFEAFKEALRGIGYDVDFLDQRHQTTKTIFNTSLIRIPLAALSFYSALKP
jgi:hypothetical protein